MTALLWVVFVAPYAVFAAARFHAWIKRRRSDREQARRDAERRARLPVSNGPGIVFRNFSVYANSQKLGTHQSSAFHLGVDATTLTVNQIVPAETEVPGSALFRNAFLADEKVEIVIGEIDGTMLQFGAMSVTSIDYSTDCKTGVTKLTASLVGPSLRQPKRIDEISVPFVGQQAFLYDVPGPGVDLGDFRITLTGGGISDDAQSSVRDYVEKQFADHGLVVTSRQDS